MTFFFVILTLINNPKMSLQYISDNNGNKTAVIISISDWNKIPQKYKEKIIEPISEISQSELKEWLIDAEKSPNISIETFNKKWENKKKEIQKLIV
jgi:hypothetical protein